MCGCFASATCCIMLAARVSIVNVAHFFFLLSPSCLSDMNVYYFYLYLGFLKALCKSQVEAVTIPNIGQGMSFSFSFM